MARVGRRPRSWLMAAAALAAAVPAAADWLVMRDGARVETKGPWTVQGSMVVFHTPNGTLSSVRLRDADLDASRAATEKAKLPPPAPPVAPPAARKPPIVITDADLKRSEPAPAADGGTAPASSPATESPAAAEGMPSSVATAAAAPAADPPAPAPAKGERLQISEWHQDLDASQAGVVLVGELRNSSPDVVGEIRVTAKLLDEGGAVMATSEALLGSNVLRPGQKTVLRASFPGVHTFSDVSFETKEFALRSFAEAGKS